MQNACKPFSLQGFMLIGVTGFEPATFGSQNRRSSQTELHPALLFCFATLLGQKQWDGYQNSFIRRCQTKQSRHTVTHRVGVQNCFDSVAAVVMLMPR